MDINELKTSAQYFIQIKIFGIMVIWYYNLIKSELYFSKLISN